MAPSAAVILSDVQYAQGDLAKAARTIDGALDMIADSTYLPSLESVRRAGCHLDGVRGRLQEATESLDHARRIAESRKHQLGRVTLACLEAHLRCFLGEFEAAAAAARRACELAGESDENVTRQEPLHWLPEAVLYGLPHDALPAAGGDPYAEALLAFADPEGKIKVPEQLPGPRRAAVTRASPRTWPKRDYGTQRRSAMSGWKRGCFNTCTGLPASEKRRNAAMRWCGASRIVWTPRRAGAACWTRGRRWLAS